MIVWKLFFNFVKQIGENQFIPQTANLLDFIFRSWDGINREANDTWGLEIYQKDYYSCETLDEAREVIKKYKEYIREPKVKHHKP